MRPAPSIRHTRATRPAGARGGSDAAYLPDLVLVQGDPLTDISTTRAIDSVWKNGHRVERDALCVSGEIKAGFACP